MHLPISFPAFACQIDAASPGSLNRRFAPCTSSLDWRNRGASSISKPAQSDVGRRAYVQVPVQSPFRVVRHQDLHLAFRQVLNPLVLGAVFPFLPFRTARASLEIAPNRTPAPAPAIRSASLPCARQTPG